MAEQTPAVGMQRKLAAIFSTDVVGYSRLMGTMKKPLSAPSLPIVPSFLP